MSDNRHLDAARQYHSGTKHSYLSVRLHPHILDWENKPLLFKIYPTLEVTRLPRDFQDTGRTALSAIAAPAVAPEGEAVPDLETLAQLLFFSAGVTRSKKLPQGETFFRAAACTGALYEVELYVVCSDLRSKYQGAGAAPALPAGVYHFGAAEFGLRQLRSGDFRQAVVDATGGDPATAHAPVIIICTGTYWRNAWKYHSRTYRHFGWDNGTILANLLAMSAAAKFPSQIVTAFVDSEVNALLGLDTKREVAFSLVSLGHTAVTPSLAAPTEPLDLPIVPYSATEIDYPAMRKMHEASSLDTATEVTSWRGNTPPHELPPAKETTIALLPLSDPKIPTDTIEQVISRRGSTREFARDPITLAQLSTMLDRSTRGIPADFLDSAGSHLNDLYLIVNNVVGLQPGAYVYHWEEKLLELLKKGEFRDKAGYLGLEQQIPADAAVDVFFLADLKKILERYGNRGYRAVQLEAGILGGKLYLAAYAQKLGCSGLTFYDDEVVSFFSPHARGKSAIFLVALGRSSVRK
ncbi:MAG TPA: SagB/ThcOx family dehydrogenase [Candidatus Dormibacteraeota bacterium]|nr:SagB/ThcOx family dehydrogenase [Candidatus Dormibacteraeota bacterium]